MTQSSRHFQIAIVGGGFGGIYCAQRVLKRLKHLEDIKVGLIAQENYMVFQPMLAEVVGGSLSPRHVVNPVRLLVPGADVLKAEVLAVDLKNKTLTLDGGPFVPTLTVTFDQLVLSPGAAMDLSRFPGMAEHAYLMRNVGDAMKLRSSIIARMEEANLVSDAAERRRILSFVVVGGGYSGVETAGQMADLLGSVCSYYEFVKPDEASVTLIHSREALLPTLDRSLGEYTKRQLEKMGVTVRLNTRVRSVTARTVQLGDGECLEATTVVCTIGNTPHPLLAKLAASGEVPMERGKIAVEATGQVKGVPWLWAVGDCAVFPKADGGSCPETAQFAMREGFCVGENLAATVFERPLMPFTFTGLGELASIGHRTAVAQIAGINFSGFIAWFMWRSIYLMKLPGLDRKLRVMVEWTFDLFFPRDINLLTPDYSSPLQEMHLNEGDVLFRAGEPAFSLYAVSAGQVDILDEEGHVVKSAGPGDHFGERALLEDKIWRYKAVAVKPTTLVAIGARTFEKMVGSMGELGSLFRRTAGTYTSADQVQATLESLPEGMRGRTVREVMCAEVAAIGCDDPVASVLEVFQKQHHSSYPVVNGQGQVLGLLKRSALYEWVQSRGMKPGVCVTEVPLVQAVRVPPDRPVAALFEELIRCGASKAVVVDEKGVLMGMVTLFDLMKGTEGR